MSIDVGSGEAVEGNRGAGKKDIPRPPIIIKGYVDLQPGGDFFDQPPLKQALIVGIEHYEKETRSNVENMYGDLASAIIRILNSFSKRQILENGTITDVVNTTQNLSIPKRYTPNAFRHALRFIFSQLDRSWPRWRTYVEGQRDERIYDKNSSKFSPIESESPEAVVRSLPLTYLAWLHEQYRLDKQLQQLLRMSAEEVDGSIKIWTIGKVNSTS